MRKNKDERAEDDDVTKKRDDGSFERFTDSLEEDGNDFDRASEGDEREEDAESERSKLHIELRVLGVRAEN